MRIKHPNHSQRGAAIVETCLVLIPLMLTAALALEISHSQQVRHVALLALYEAARAGSVAGANQQIVNQTFKQAILPSYAARGIHQSPADRLESHAKKILRVTGLRRWEIDVMNPNISVFKDFSHTELSKKLGRAALRNDYLVEQHQHNIRRGWPEGRGPISRQTIFEANTLRLHLSLIYRPLVPGTGMILKILSRTRADRTGIAWSKGYLVANLTTEVMMQSHAQQWETIQGEYTTKHSQTIKQQINRASIPIESKQTEPMQRADTQIKSEQTRKVVFTERTLTKGRQIKSLTDTSAAEIIRSDENNICEGLICCQ